MLDEHVDARNERFEWHLADAGRLALATEAAQGEGRKAGLREEAGSIRVDAAARPREHEHTSDRLGVRQRQSGLDEPCPVRHRAEGTAPKKVRETGLFWLHRRGSGHTVERMFVGATDEAIEEVVGQMHGVANASMHVLLAGVVELDQREAWRIDGA